MFSLRGQGSVGLLAVTHGRSQYIRVSFGVLETPIGDRAEHAKQKSYSHSFW